MEAKDWVGAIGIIATACTSGVTLLLSNRRERFQQIRDDRLREEARMREDQIRAAERSLVPRTRIDVECKFLGPQHGRYIAETCIIVDNIGNVRRTFRHMKIRLRGIKADQALERWEPDPSRLNFPVKILEADLVPKGEQNYYFVEPGVFQIFTYVTDVAEEIRYVLAHVNLETKREPNESEYENLFTSERVYVLPT